MTILVLEDRETRVDWLRAAVGVRCDVRHAETVDEFARMLAEGTPRLIVLDHDLGDPDGTDAGTGKDEHGRDGRDAARLCPVGVPVVVWSHNEPAAREMVAILGDRDVAAVQVPFVMRDRDLKPILRRLLRELEVE